MALAGVMLHKVEETKEVLQPLKTDLVTNKLTSIQMQDCGSKSHSPWCDESVNQLAEIKTVKFNSINKGDEFDLCRVRKNAYSADVVAVESSLAFNSSVT